MKRILFIAAIMLLPGIKSLMANQQPQFTQYMFNDYVINPAIAGTIDYYWVKTNFRQQWTGIKDAPTTFVLSSYGPHKSMPMGYGGYLFSDQVGPTKMMGLYGSFAYNIRLMRDIRLSMGLFLGVLQFKIDWNSTTTSQPENISSDKYSKVSPDATFGLYLYTSQYYAGFSAHQLFANQLPSISDSSDVSKKLRRLTRNFYLTGGYKLNVNRDFDVEPSLLIKMVTAAPPQLDISCRAIYQKMVWLGLTYRTGDAISVLLGYNYNDMINIGYSYDFTTSKLRNYSSGSHEIMIGVKFMKIKQSKSSRKIR